jgi:hypothetical protein
LARFSLKLLKPILPQTESEERAMYVISIVFGLFLASLANVVCLYGYL